MESIEGDQCAKVNFVVGGQSDGIALVVIRNGGRIVHLDNRISGRVDVGQWV